MSVDDDQCSFCGVYRVDAKMLFGGRLLGTFICAKCAGAYRDTARAESHERPQAQVSFRGVVRGVAEERVLAALAEVFSRLATPEAVFLVTAHRVGASGPPVEVLRLVSPVDDTQTSV